MINKKLRLALAEYCKERDLEEYEQPIILDNHAYDNSIIGLTEDNHLIYNYESMIQEFMEDEECSEEEALEWIEYNTMRALGYINQLGPGPIILYQSTDLIIENYLPYNYEEDLQEK